MTIENISCNKSFGGWHKQYKHQSRVLDCEMRFAIFLPPQAAEKPVPVLYWLSGLTCTDENFMQKAGAQRMAAELGMAIVAPDTSPRGDGVPDDADKAYDLGLGAGFYLNATRAPWNRHYHMFDYVVDELPALIEAHFPVTGQRAISGHSMGGHGALVIGLSHPHRYSSISAFSPIANPMACPWGEKAFAAYLGENREHWRQYDACELLKLAVSEVPILIDQGDADTFLEQQLRPQQLVEIAGHKGYPLDFRLQPGYDHSYYFIASFIEQHLTFHSLYF
ncbi:S-formylglutathione hydrolase [Shewanella sp. AS16]|uniref:S-formylglutathione hydrolase n=1 Tax=Shewanella sp. AS16 TaxID=2907625 RepID=UPI001F364DF5|nr:S-formylglutathione hydrolase [Shewanella sp. AS16]MCE9684784.1 S-formylglutathione hydrolase [Shewanella sp. AS16]